MRQIKQKLVDYLDGKLQGNGIAQQAISVKDARTVFVEACRACVGIREATGHNDGPLVEALQDTIGGHSGEPWCMSTMQSCLAYAELKTGIKSPIYPSEYCINVWAQTPVEQRVKSIPLPGAIVIWKHGNTSSGHTGCVIGADEKTFQAVEGNTTSGTDPNGKVIREGGGCYFTKRSMAGNGDMHVVGFLKAF